MIDLQAIFGGGSMVSSVASEPAPVVQPEAAPFIDAATPPFSTVVAPFIVPEVAPMMMMMTPEMAPFDDLDLPGPACPVCGGLEKWTAALGRQRCGVCDGATLEKALKLAELAARLREQAQRRKPAPRIAPGCVSGGMADTLDLGDKRPARCVYGGCAGREDGQGGIVKHDD